MPRMIRLACCALVALLLPLTAPAATLFEGSVEHTGARTDSTWTAVRGSATPDASVFHEGKKSLRIEPSASSPDACVRSTPIALSIGKTYELTGWVRTEELT